MAKGILSAFEKGVPLKPYLLVGENTTISRLFAYVEAITGTQAPDFQSSSSWVGRMAGFASMAKAKVAGSSPALTPKVRLFFLFLTRSALKNNCSFSQSVEYFNQEWAYISTTAEKELGYRSRPLRTGLQETLKWLRTRNLNT